MPTRRGSRERCFLHGERGFRACVPEKDLSTVGTTKEEGRMEGGEFGRENVRVGVEGVFRAGAQMHVPDLKEARRVLWCRGVFGV